MVTNFDAGLVANAAVSYTHLDVYKRQDKYVIDVPFLLRALLVRGIILQTRPKKSAEAYARIWTSEGSPLIVLSKKMHQKVQKLVDVPVALAMRYGTITIEKGLQELKDKGVTEVMLLALYPQYAMASVSYTHLDVYKRQLLGRRADAALGRVRSGCADPWHLLRPTGDDALPWRSC